MPTCKAALPSVPAVVKAEATPPFNKGNTLACRVATVKVAALSRLDKAARHCPEVPVPYWLISTRLIFILPPAAASVADVEIVIRPFTAVVKVTPLAVHTYNLPSVSSLILNLMKY